MHHAILGGVERAMLTIHLLRSHRQFITVLAGVETYGVIPAIGLSHAFGKGAGVNQVRQASGVLVIFFVVLLLRPDDSAHVTQGVGFGLRTGRVSLELWLICGLRR